MAPDVAGVDESFFAKFNQTSLIETDRSTTDQYILFNQETYNKLFLEEDEQGNLIKKYPTIYHLRKRLVEDPSQEDIRLVYLALHHLVKYRGNFLIENKDLTASSADGAEALAALKNSLVEYCEEYYLPFNEDAFDVTDLNLVLTQASYSRAERKEKFAGILKQCFEKENRDFYDSICKAVFGYQVSWEKVLEVEASSDTKFSFAKEDKLTKFEEELLPENAAEIFTCIKMVYNAYLLAGILKGAEGGTLSSSMVDLYN
jgi:CRISPR-associated endonuclease Csn1